MEDFVEKMKAANQNFLEEIISLWEASKRQLEEHTDIKVEELKAGLEEVQRRNLKVEKELINLGEEKRLVEVAKEEAVKEVEVRLLQEREAASEEKKRLLEDLESKILEEKRKREVDLEERDKQLELIKSGKVAAEEKFESDRARMEEELRKLKSQLEANEVDKDLKEKAYQEKMKEMNMRMEAELQKEREKLTKKCKELEKKVRVFEEGEKKHLEDLEELKGVANADQAKITELEEEVKKLEGFKETAGELIYGAGSQILVRLWFVIGFWPPTPNTTDTQQLTHILFIVDMIYTIYIHTYIQYQCKKITDIHPPTLGPNVSTSTITASTTVSLSVAVPV